MVTKDYYCLNEYNTEDEKKEENERAMAVKVTPFRREYK